MSVNPAALAYPRSRHGPAPLVDLSDPAVRDRLGPGAVKAFFRLVDLWKLRDEDARALLGGLSNGAYYELKKDPSRRLDADRLTRVSCLVGIFKALRILYDEPLADRWISLPNRNRLFEGATPLSYLVRGGLPAALTVRRLLDARRAG